MSSDKKFKAQLGAAHTAALRYQAAIKAKQQGKPVDVGDEETEFAVRALAIWGELVKRAGGVQEDRNG